MNFGNTFKRSWRLHDAGFRFYLLFDIVTYLGVRSNQTMLHAHRTTENLSDGRCGASPQATGSWQATEASKTPTALLE
jgi:hypothetical protein